MKLRHGISGSADVEGGFGFRVRSDADSSGIFWAVWVMGWEISGGVFRGKSGCVRMDAL